MQINWRFWFFIFTNLVGVATTVIIVYMAMKLETKLLIGALVFVFFWFLWIKRSGWYLLPTKFRNRLKNVIRLRGR